MVVPISKEVGMLNGQQREERIRLLTRKIMEYSTELNILMGEPASNYTTTGEYIKHLVEEIFRIEDINARGATGKLSRKEKIVEGRQAARYLMSRYTNLTLYQIAIITGATEHSVVSNSTSTCIEVMAVDNEFRNKILQCIFRIQSSK